MNLIPKSHHTYVAAAVFFMIVTAQTLWSTIHGDGSVYAWMIREICNNPSSLLIHPLAWTRAGYFIDHPYFFFYFAAPISKIFGTGDVGIKIPNYIVGFLSLWMVYKIANQSKSAIWPGLLAGYVLISNPLYELMLKQPTLDPLAQLLSLVSIYLLLNDEKPEALKFFYSGLLMGLAFLTKGLELLPHLGALFILVCVLIKKHKMNPFKILSLGLVGLALPILAWFFYDRLFWNQTWFNSYFDRQIKDRFFNAENTHTVINLNYIKNLVSKYFVQMGIIIWGSIKLVKQGRSLGLFWWYTVIYTVFNITAFSVIKKDSSQHLTGIFLFSSILAGQYLYEFVPAVSKKILSISHYVVAIAVFIMWGWFMTHENNKPDLWTFIKNQTEFFSQPENQLPVVLADDVDDITGVYFTAQWYWRNNKIYFSNEAKSLLSSQTVFLITKKDNNSFNIERTVYRP
ncbi:MAG: glycosyltransferase family 39 protein [Moraxellaceae bacterium]|nr:glycosyltransferase family 39 protein [Pseudobdellovibrionaceae bacterium]